MRVCACVRKAAPLRRCALKVVWPRLPLASRPPHPSTARRPPPRTSTQIAAEARDAIRTGDYASGKVAAERFLEEATAHYGEQHPAVASALNNLALVHKHLGNLQEAVDTYEKALTTYREVVGEDHPSTITATANCGECAAGCTWPCRAQGKCWSEWSHSHPSLLPSFPPSLLLSLPPSLLPLPRSTTTVVVSCTQAWHTRRWQTRLLGLSAWRLWTRRRGTLSRRWSCGSACRGTLTRRWRSPWVKWLPCTGCR